MSNKWVRYILIGIGAVLALCICLGAGVFVVRSNTRSQGRSGGPIRQMFSFGSGHGAIGTIERIDHQTLSVRRRDGKLQTVVVNNDTRIEENRKRITSADLELNDQITVIGSPDSQGQIVARWIRVLRSSPPLDHVTPTLTPGP